MGFVLYPREEGKGYCVPEEVREFPMGVSTGDQQEPFASDCESEWTVGLVFSVSGGVWPC